MNPPRFRPPRKRWRVPLVLLVLVCAGLLLRRPSESERIDPQRWSPSSGEYSVHEICADGSFDVMVPTAYGDRIARVELLGVELDAGSLVPIVRLLRERLGDSSIRLRFDRRRTTEDTGELQAYVFAGDLLLNEELVRHGLAKEATHPSDSGPMIRRIKKAEQAAREGQVGIWRDVSDP